MLERDLTMFQGKLTELQVLLQAKPHIDALYLFGSAGTELERDSSDVDLGVVFASNESMGAWSMAGLAAEIETLLSVGPIDLVDLRLAPLELQYRAVRDGRILYERTKGRAAHYMEEVLNEYLDYQPFLEAMHAEYLRSFARRGRNAREQPLG